MSFAKEVGIEDKKPENIPPVVVKAKHPPYILPMFLSVILGLFYVGLTVFSDYHRQLEMEAMKTVIDENFAKIHEQLGIHLQHLKDLKNSKEENKIEKEIEKKQHHILNRCPNCQRCWR